MKNSLPSIAFFSITFALLASLAYAPALHAQGMLSKDPIPTYVPQVADIKLVAPATDQTYVSGNRYPISWHANIPEIKQPYHLVGELRLLDQGPPDPRSNKDLRIARLGPDELAKGTYQFLAGSQTDLTYNHKAAAPGRYKIWMVITGYTDCATSGKCPPLFETSTQGNAFITIK